LAIAGALGVPDVTKTKLIKFSDVFYTVKLVLSLISLKLEIPMFLVVLLIEIDLISI